jgi:hypothetical protein
MYTTQTPIDTRHFNVRYTDSDYHFGIYKLFYIEKLNIHMQVRLECWYKQMGNLQLES